jgi:hypothetical protein
VKTSVDKLSEALAMVFYAGRYTDKVENEPNENKAVKEMVEFSELHAPEFRDKAIRLLDSL